jgi:hypothetical protein
MIQELKNMAELIWLGLQTTFCFDDQRRRQIARRIAELS